MGLTQLAGQSADENLEFEITRLWRRIWWAIVNYSVDVVNMKRLHSQFLELCARIGNEKVSKSTSSL